MKRRTFISRSGILITSMTVGSGALLTYGCHSDSESLVDSVISAEEKKLLNELGEIIIPKTDTPGAKEANVGEYIGLIVQDCYNEDDQMKFKANLLDVEKRSNQKFNRSFLKCTVSERQDVLSEIEDNGEYFKSLKGFITSAYLSSEMGKTQFFEYYPVPGNYDGCSVQRPW